MPACTYPTGGTNTGPTDSSANDYYNPAVVSSETDVSDVFDQLADDKAEERPKSKQDWKQKNKRKLPRWAR